jgi:LPS export ABC transporter protein LptC
MVRFLIWLVFGFGLSISACQQESVQELPDILLKNPALELLDSVEILYSDSAVVKVRITGPQMYNHTNSDNPQQEFPKGIQVEFLGRGGEILSTLTAKYALRREQASNIMVRDSVVWKSSRQETLTTDELTWDERRQRIFTDRFVILTRRDEILYGRGFEADQDFSNISMKAVEGRVQMDKDKHPTTLNPSQ